MKGSTYLYQIPYLVGGDPLKSVNGGTSVKSFRLRENIMDRLTLRAGNEPNQLENSSRLDSIINSLDLVHEPNESNLSSKLSS